MVTHLTKNVNKGHLQEIFGNFGKVKRVEFAIDHKTKMTRGYAFVEFEAKSEADDAIVCMNTGQIDGQNVRAEFKKIDLDSGNLDILQKRKSISPRKRRPSPK